MTVQRDGAGPADPRAGQALTGGAPHPTVGGVNRAITLLAVGAFLALLIGVLAAGGGVEVVAVGAVFTLVGTAGFGWVARRGRLRWSVGYVAVQLPLAFVTFTLDPGAGATLLLVVVVLVCQCVLLLPLPATAVVIALVPFVHTVCRGGRLCASAPRRKSATYLGGPASR